MREPFSELLGEDLARGLPEVVVVLALGDVFAAGLLEDLLGDHSVLMLELADVRERAVVLLVVRLCLHSTFILCLRILFCRLLSHLLQLKHFFPCFRQLGVVLRISATDNPLAGAFRVFLFFAHPDQILQVGILVENGLNQRFRIARYLVFELKLQELFDHGLYVFKRCSDA